MTEKNQDTNYLRFNNRGFSSQQMKLLREMFDRQRIFVRTANISSTTAQISELTFNGKSGKNYHFRVNIGGKGLDNSSSFTFTLGSGVDLSAEGNAIIVTGTDLDYFADGGYAAMDIDNDLSISAVGTNLTVDGNFCIMWEGVLSVPSNQSIAPSITINGTVVIHRIMLEINELE